MLAVVLLTWLLVAIVGSLAIAALCRAGAQRDRRQGETDRRQSGGDRRRQFRPAAR